MSQKLTFAAIFVAVFGVGAWWIGQGTNTLPALSTAANAQSAEATPEQLAMVPDMTMGDSNAPVTLIEYASFTCPHCASFHDTIFEKLKTDYIDTGKVHFVYREVYLDRFGLWAGMVARCGGESKYFGITDMFYKTQREWIADGSPATVAENLRKIGLKAGLSSEQINTCLNDATMAEAMVATYQQNATKHGVRGTPTVVIDDVKYDGSMSFSGIAEALDAKLTN